MIDRERIAELRKPGQVSVLMLAEALDGWERALDEIDETTGTLEEQQSFAAHYLRERDEARELVKRLMPEEDEHGRPYLLGPRLRREAEAKLREWGMG